MDKLNDNLLLNPNEKPLERLVEGYSYTSIFCKIAVIGDSLSSGEFESHNSDGSTGYNDFFEYSWGQYLARKNGCVVYNFSRGGMTASEYVESFADIMGFWDKEKACQAYIIALGVNDLICLKGEIGSVKDIDVNNYKNNKKTFAGYIGTIISRYKEIEPNAKFFLMTLPRSDRTHEQESIVNQSQLMRDLTSLFSNTYVIDLEAYAPIYNADFRNCFYLGGHMNPLGYVFTAKIVDSYIDYIVRHKYNDFKQVGFIGTEFSFKE